MKNITIQNIKKSLKTLKPKVIIKKKINEKIKDILKISLEKLE